MKFQNKYLSDITEKLLESKVGRYATDINKLQQDMKTVLKT
jgi:hypothetical protein